MKRIFFLLIPLIFSFIVQDTIAQDTNKTDFRKIDLNVNFNIVGKINYKEGNYSEPKAVQAILTFYPLQFRNTQMGFSLGYEKMEVRSSDSVTIKENRIPILATAKINLSKQQAVYLRTQLGTALILSSESKIDTQNSVQNYRNDIGAPIIFNLGLGVNLPFNRVGVGIELGYSYKQLGYKLENNYKQGALYLGLSISFP